MTLDQDARAAADQHAERHSDGHINDESMARVGPPDCGEEVLFYRRAGEAAPRPKLIRKRDIGEAALHAVMAAVAATRSPDTWPGFCRRVTRLRHGRLVRGLGPFRDGLRAVMGEVPEPEVERYFDQWWDGQHRRRMMLVREYVGGGPVRFTLTGREHLDAAAALGRGVILWAAPLTSQTLAGKRGLFEAGIRAYQVSSRHHGFWDTYTRFGDRYLNRLLVGAENRYLAGRLTFERDDAGMLVRRILRTLKTGAAVILTNNLYAGRSFVEMRFGKAGFISMPTTPIALALRGRVPLLSWSTIEREPLSHYEIRMSADLAAEECAAGEASPASHDYPAMARIALRTRDEILAAVMEAPDQLLSWPPFARSVPLRPG
jgi:lauroyl/myristoyl acyltransferase